MFWARWTPGFRRSARGRLIEASNSGEQLIDLSGGTWVEDDEAVLAAVLPSWRRKARTTLATTGTAPTMTRPPTMQHFAQHDHVHADGTSHAPRPHRTHDAERAHDQPGQTQSFANDMSHRLRP